MNNCDVIVYKVWLSKLNWSHANQYVLLFNHDSLFAWGSRCNISSLIMALRLRKSLGSFEQCSSRLVRLDSARLSDSPTAFQRYYLRMMNCQKGQSCSGFLQCNFTCLNRINYEIDYEKSISPRALKTSRCLRCLIAVHFPHAITFNSNLFGKPE